MPATRIFTIADISADPHYRARGMLVPTPDDKLGSVTLAAPMPRLSDTPCVLHHAGRAVGHHTRAVLREVAGLSPQEIERLFARGTAG